MHRKWTFHTKTFWAYLSSFLAVALIPLLTIWIALQTALSNSVQQQFLAYEARMFQSANERMTSAIEYSQKVTSQFSSSSAFRQLMLNTDLSADERQNSILDVRDALGSLTFGESSYTLPFLYIPHKSMVVNNSGAISTLESTLRFSASFLSVDAQTMHDLIVQSKVMTFLPADSLTSNGSHIGVVLPLNTNYLYRDAYFVAFCHTKILTDGIASHLPPGSKVSIFTTDGIYLTGESAELPAQTSTIRLDGIDYLPFISQTNVGLQFVYHVPQAQVLSQITHYQQWTVGLMAILVCMCCALAFWMAQRHYRPIQQLYNEVFPGERPRDGELKRVSEQMRLAREQNEAYANQVHEQFSQLRNQLVLQLLTLPVQNASALNELLEMYDIRLKNGPYAVAITSHCTDELLQGLSGAIKCDFPATDHCAIIVRECDRDAAIGVLKSLGGGWSISKDAADVFRLSRCFRDAMSQLNSVSEQQHQAFPLDHHLRLTQALNDFDLDACLSFINEIVSSEQCRSLSPIEQLHLMQKIAATAFHVFIGCGSNASEPARLMDRILSMDEPDEMGIAWVHDLYRAVIRATHKQDNSSPIVATVKAYIEQNYADKDLSLQTLAEVSRVSYHYLSHLFNSSGSQSFSDLLNACRIQKAQELLASEMPIKEIAQRVGYSNASYFSSMFRRITQVSPQQYRRDHQKK